MPASLALTGAMNDIINECAMRTLWGVWAKDVLVIRSWPASEIAGLPASSWREPCVRGLDLPETWIFFIHSLSHGVPVPPLFSFPNTIIFLWD